MVKQQMRGGIIQQEEPRQSVSALVAFGDIRGLNEVAKRVASGFSGNFAWHLRNMVLTLMIPTSIFYWFLDLMPTAKVGYVVSSALIKSSSLWLFGDANNYLYSISGFRVDEAWGGFTILVGVLGGMLNVTFTFAPSFITFIFSALAKEGLMFASWTVLMANTFDMLTDTPQVYQISLKIYGWLKESVKGMVSANMLPLAVLGTAAISMLSFSVLLLLATTVIEKFFWTQLFLAYYLHKNSAITEME
jgi:hypothetical protein